MSDIVHQRCFHHLEREAAARCPRCTRYYCRECVTEHDDAVVCAACLRVEHAATQAKRKRNVAPAIFNILRPVGGFILLWLLFWLLGQGLLLIPSSFHEGSFWKQDDKQNLRDAL